MEQQISRRSFLKTSGAVAAGVAAASLSQVSFANAADAASAVASASGSTSASAAQSASASASGSASASAAASAAMSASGSASGSAKASGTASGTDSWMPAAWDEEADVVVCGYGSAGASAAITAADAGSKVILLEKMDEENAGGDTSVSGGFIDLGFRGGVDMTLEEYLSDTMYQATEEDANAFLDKVKDLDNFTASIGVQYAEHNGQLYVVDPDYPDKLGSNGYVLYNYFKDAVKSRSGITVEYEMPAFDLVQDPVTKEILGVKAGTKDAPKYIKGNKAVILSCGGWESNDELMEGMLTPGMHFPCCGSPANTGDALMMCMKAGVKVKNLGWTYECDAPCFKQISEEYGTAIEFGRGIGGEDVIDFGYMYVNAAGKRFINETYFLPHTKDYPNSFLDFAGNYFLDTDEVGYVNLPAWLIMDDETFNSGVIGRKFGDGSWSWNAGSPYHHLYEWSDDNQAELQAGYFITADTVEELGSKLSAVNYKGETVNMDATTLAQTVDSFNTMCDNGEDTDFGRSADTMMSLVTPPFYAIEITMTNLYTIGGPSHDTKAQAIDWDNNPVPRLFICGNAGDDHRLRTPATAGAMTWGRIAGENAAALDPQA